MIFQYGKTLTAINSCLWSGTIHACTLKCHRPCTRSLRMDRGPLRCDPRGERGGFRADPAVTPLVLIARPPLPMARPCPRTALPSVESCFIIDPGAGWKHVLLLLLLLLLLLKLHLLLSKSYLLLRNTLLHYRLALLHHAKILLTTLLHHHRLRWPHLDCQPLHDPAS